MTPTFKPPGGSSGAGRAPTLAASLLVLYLRSHQASFWGTPAAATKALCETEPRAAETLSGQDCVWSAGTSTSTTAALSEQPILQEFTRRWL